MNTLNPTSTTTTKKSSLSLFFPSPSSSSSSFNILFIIVSCIIIIQSFSSSSYTYVNGVGVSMYEGYAFIGSNANSKMSFATLMSKPNRSIPYSTNNQYHISQVFSDSTSLYGSSVAVGPGSYSNGTAVVLGAIGSPNENAIYIYNVELCTNITNCDPLFTFQDVAKHKNGSKHQQQRQQQMDGNLDSFGKISKKEFECTIGGIIGIGPNFIVSTCKNDLMNTKKSSSPIVFCFIDLDKVAPNSNNNCTIITPYDSDFNPCPRERGQLYVTAVDVHKTYVSFTYCAVCMSPTSSKLYVQFQTAFEVLNVTSPGVVERLTTIATNRTNSCPTSIALEYDWIVLGYAEEASIDLFTKGNETNSNFTFFETINSDLAGFGSDVALGDSLLVVATPGTSKNQNQNAGVVFYELYKDDNGTSRRASIEASVPNLNYQTIYNYGYQVAYYGNELSVISLDESGTRVGFNVYSVCPYGMEWSSEFLKCSMCQAGQYKSVSNPMANSSFELCFPCPGGYYTGPVMGIASEIECRMFNCSDEQFCPEGSIYPLSNLLVETNSNSIPNPISTDELDFESTFYNSYPWFLIILGFAVILTVLVCLPWPAYNKLQAKLIKVLLKLNFYDWDGEEMTEEVDYLERAQNPSINGSYGNLRESVPPFGQKSSKRGIFIRKRRTKVKPQKAVESFCSYYFLLVLAMMILFIIQFQKVNSDLSIDLRAYGQTSTDLDLKGRYTEVQYLRLIDMSPLRLTLDMYGYSGQCITEEVELQIKGCQTLNYMGTCQYDLKMEILNFNGTSDGSSSSSGESSESSTSQGSSEEGGGSSSDSSSSSSSSSSSASSSSDVPVNKLKASSSSFSVGQLMNHTCRITVTFDKGSEYSDLSSYSIKILPTNNYYFYAQRLVYNVSTANNESMIAQGNSYVSGIIQPPKYMILRPNAEVSVLSMLTFMTDCSIHSSSDDFTLVRPMVEKCEFDKLSYKDFSFISNATSYLDPSDYHDADPSFTFQVNIEKSVFFRYVTSSHSVTFGQIVTVIMFAMLDVFWVIEVIVPVVQTVVALVENASKRAKRKEYDEIGTKPFNEMDPLIPNSSPMN